VAKFDILATVVETRSGEYLVMVSSVPRPAWSGMSDLEEARARTREDGDELCTLLIAALRGRLAVRGDEIGDVIGPQWPVSPARTYS
jgi:hypothetical protein